MSGTFHIRSLHIQNFATFKNQTITFRPGFNVIVGETGSGKSLVLDALQLILGGRADKKIVRKDTDYSLIEASFYCADEGIKAFLTEEGFPFEGNELLIKRVITKSGTSKTYVNHLSCTVNFLSSFARRYIDLVGQFENQKLLSGVYQLSLLDHYAALKDDVSAFRDLYRTHKELITRREELELSRGQREQRLDYLNYQLSEIDKLEPSSQDEEELLKKKNLLINLEKTQRLSAQMREVFEGSEGSGGLQGSLKQLSSLLFKNRDLCQGQEDLLLVIQEQISELQGNLERTLNMELDPEELEGVLDRLDLYQKVKKKFGGTVESVLEARDSFRAEQQNLVSVDTNLDEVSGRIENLKKQLQAHGEKLHLLRTRKAQKLEQELTRKVRLLKMSGATFRIDLQKNEEFLESGITRLEFMVETNKGEGFYRVKDIASGGELSRILLGLRQILCSCDSISIFLFDEIDTGIGGETGTCIGKALKEVADSGQVIAITHLPQIAQYADSLIVVQKEIQKERKETRTESMVREISGKMIIKEVQAMAQLH